MALAASAADPTFDYMGTGRGDAEIRGKCKKLEGKLSCEITEVWAAPMASGEESNDLRRAFNNFNSPWSKQSLSPKRRGRPIEFEEVPRDELVEFWKEDFLKRAEDGLENIPALKEAECQRDPRDYYEFRAAYNETFDAFNEKAKEVQAKLCAADGAKGFAKAKVARWDLVRSTCELRYATYEMVFKKGDVNWVNEGATRGSHPNLGCYLRMRTELSCSEEKGCRLTRSYQPDPTEWNRRFGIGRCQGEPAALELSFDPSKGQSRPQSCKYMLDRLRASECCAFSK